MEAVVVVVAVSLVAVPLVAVSLVAVTFEETVPLLLALQVLTDSQASTTRVTV